MIGAMDLVSTNALPGGYRTEGALSLLSIAWLAAQMFDRDEAGCAIPRRPRARFEQFRRLNRDGAESNQPCNLDPGRPGVRALRGSDADCRSAHRPDVGHKG